MNEENNIVANLNEAFDLMVRAINKGMERTDPFPITAISFARLVELYPGADWETIVTFFDGFVGQYGAYPENFTAYLSDYDANTACKIRMMTDCARFPGIMAKQWPQVFGWYVWSGL
jgi:hypothetical protein